MNFATEEELSKIRPKHPDFDRLAAAATEADDEADKHASGDYGKYLEKIFDMPESDIVNTAIGVGVELFTEYSRPKSQDRRTIISYYRLAWSAGFFEARYKITNIDYMADDPLHEKPEFCGVDRESFKYVADQRILRLLMANEVKNPNEPNEYYVLLATCWIDGYSTALRY